jgi:hypothetical protein
MFANHIDANRAESESSMVEQLHFRTWPCNLGPGDDSY